MTNAELREVMRKEWLVFWFKCALLIIGVLTVAVML